LVLKNTDWDTEDVAPCAMTEAVVPMLFVDDASPACVVAQTRSDAGLLGFANVFPDTLAKAKFDVLPTT
jgi:hypothetical protein